MVRAAARGRWGRVRGPLARRLVRLTRQLLPTREHHKFWMIRLLNLVKPVVLEASDHLVVNERIARVDDVWFLTMPDLVAALDGATQPLPISLIHETVREILELYNSA